MAGQFPTPVSDWSDKEYESYTFGPFTATELATPTNGHYRLPVEFVKDTIIHDVRLKLGTVSTPTSVVALTKGSVDATTKIVTAPSGALVASPTAGANQVCTGRDIKQEVVANRLEWLPVQKGYLTTKATTFTSQVVPGDPNKDPAGTGRTKVYDNIIEKGNNLYLYYSASPTGLAALYVTIRVGERKN
jgi:hypothetical protein